ncbi:sugar-binding protein [Halanaerocella petrolearia]
MFNKKSIAIALVLVLAVGCVSFISSKAEAWWIFGEDKNEEQQKTFAVVPKLITHPYFKASADGANKAGKELGVDVRFVGPQKADAARQVSTIENLIVQGVDGIAVSPVDATAIKSVIERAMDRDIPVITFDADAPESKRISYIGTGNKKAGGKAGAAMVKKLNGKGKVAIMTGQLGAQNLQSRIAGFKEALKGTDVEVVKVEANQDDMSLALSQAEALLQAYDLDGIFACSATGAPAAAQAVKTKGLTDEVTIIGFDDMPQTLDYIREGTVYATIAQRPDLMGYQSVKQLLKLSKGKEVPKYKDTGVEVVTKDNINSYKD